MTFGCLRSTTAKKTSLRVCRLIRARELSKLCRQNGLRRQSCSIASDDEIAKDLCRIRKRWTNISPQKNVLGCRTIRQPKETYGPLARARELDFTTGI